MSRLDVRPHFLLEGVTDTRAAEDGGSRQACFVQRDRSSDINLDLLIVLFEPPPKKRTIREADADAAMPEEVGRHHGYAVLM